MNLAMSDPRVPGRRPGDTDRHRRQRTKNLFMFGFHNQPGSSLTTDFASQMITFAVDNGLDFTLVPEPTNLALLALGAGALMRRRRR